MQCYSASLLEILVPFDGKLRNLFSEASIEANSSPAKSFAIDGNRW